MFIRYLINTLHYNWMERKNAETLVHLTYELVVSHGRQSAARRWSSCRASCFLIARKHIGRYSVEISKTDCSKEEGMCSLADAASLRCLLI